MTNDYNEVRRHAQSVGMKIVKAGIKINGRNLFIIACDATGEVLSNPNYTAYFASVIAQDGHLQRYTAN